MGKLAWAEERREEIISSYLDGNKQSEIAKKFNVSQSFISNCLRSWGVSNPDSNRFRRVEMDEDTIRRMYWDEEMHPSQIAKTMGCSKQVILNRMKDWGIPVRTISQSHMGKLNPLFNSEHKEETKKKLSDSFYNRFRNFGFSANWGKPTFCKTPNQGEVRMRSGWEAKVGAYLTNRGVNWYYEYAWIDLGNTKYLPDFYLQDLDIYIEVKGRTRGLDVEKVLLARKAGYKVALWDAEELIKRGIIDNTGDTETNRKYKDFTYNWESADAEFKQLAKEAVEVKEEI